MQRGLRRKELHTGLTANNARVICDSLRKLDKRSKFSYYFENDKNN